MQTALELMQTPLLGKALWVWLVFAGIVLTLLALDLGVLHKDDREIGVRESLLLSGDLWDEIWRRRKGDCMF